MKLYLIKRGFKGAQRCALAGLLAIAGCGGDGSGGSDTTANDPAPANGSYAGTYACGTIDTNGTLSITAVLPTATGAFSSCGGTGASGAVNITCTGSIKQDGTLSISGLDTHRNTITLTGQATGKIVTGTYNVVPANVSGSFTCTH